MLKQFAGESEKNRLENFTDAILAIIMTILVLEFKVPEKAFESGGDIRSYLEHLFPAIISYLVSFATIVILWLDHHNIFRLIKKTDIKFVFLNFLFILFLSATPFTTALAGRNHESSFAVALVAANYAMMNLSFTALWLYAMTHKMIPEEIMKTLATKRENTILCICFLLILASIPMAFVHTYISFIFFTLVVILHLIRIWKH